MLMFSLHSSQDQYELDATKYPYECKYSTGNEQFWDTYDFSMTNPIFQSLLYKHSWQNATDTRNVR